MAASQLNGDKMSLRHRHNGEMKHEAVDICINFLIADATPATAHCTLYKRLQCGGSSSGSQSVERRTRGKRANGNCSRTRTKYMNKRVHD